jgi:dual specificity protein kinase YAK1
MSYILSFSIRNPANSPQLNSKYDKNDDHHLLRLKDTFIHRQHLCLAFELLSVNLYELIKQNQFRGLSTTLVRVFAQQLLNALSLLNKAHLIHCDLKPENILLKKSVTCPRAPRIWF